MTDPVRAADETDDITTDEVVVNGVNARSGRYGVSALPAKLLAAIAEQRPLSAAELDELQERLHRAKAHLGVADHIDPNDLAKSGWGVVFAQDDPETADALEALTPLLEKRSKEAGKHYRVFAEGDGIAPNEPGRKFLARKGSAPGPVDPENGVPYYLLIVGSPERVPFDAQTDFSVRHAVGRLDLGSIDALATYAEETVRREKDATPMAKRAAVFATRNPGDVATQRSLRMLATPVATAFESQANEFEDWTVQRFFAKDAEKKPLRDLLHDGPAPSILFSASHGALFPLDDADLQRAVQGALVTQKWPGPMQQDRPLTDEELFTANDLADGVTLGGMIAFLFACYSAGTPAFDEFLPPETGALRSIAPKPFVARLPQRMLECGASAVIGHVERAWTTSFRWPGTGATTTAFTSVLHALARGARVGAALEHLTRRYTEVSTELAEELRLRRANIDNDDVVAGLWTAQTDARNFVIIGDPAVRLTVAANQ